MHTPHRHWLNRRTATDPCWVMFSLLPLRGSDAEWLQVHALDSCPDMTCSSIIYSQLHANGVNTVNRYLLAVGSFALAFLSPSFLIYKISQQECSLHRVVRIKRIIHLKCLTKCLHMVGVNECQLIWVSLCWLPKMSSSLLQPSPVMTSNFCLYPLFPQSSEASLRE